MATNGKNRGKSVSVTAFVKAWQSSTTIDEVVEKIVLENGEAYKMTPASCFMKAYKIRKELGLALRQLNLPGKEKKGTRISDVKGNAQVMAELFALCGQAPAEIDAPTTTLDLPASPKGKKGKVLTPAG